MHSDGKLSIAREAVIWRTVLHHTIVAQKFALNLPRKVLHNSYVIYCVGVHYFKFNHVHKISELNTLCLSRSVESEDTSIFITTGASELTI